MRGKYALCAFAPHWGAAVYVCTWLSALLEGASIWMLFATQARPASLQMPVPHASRLLPLCPRGASGRAPAPMPVHRLPELGGMHFSCRLPVLHFHPHWHELHTACPTAMQTQTRFMSSQIAQCHASS